ncbi:MAG: glycosyltransferase [Flavobacteriales bacterium]|nr:glycosyltransferase [Flavobacteriales bacterium]
MKITIIGPAYPYRGGIALFSTRLAEEFQHAGHDVNVVTFKLQYPSFLFPGKTQFAEGEAPSLSISRDINSVVPFNWMNVGKQIRNQNPDLVIFNYWMPFMAPCFGSIARQIRKNGHSKLIGLVHNFIPHERHKFDLKMSAYFARQMDGFLAMSDSVLKDIQQVDHLKPKTISPHPMYDNFGAALSRDEALGRLGLDTNYRYLLFFGIIRKYKGLDLMLKAFADDRINNGKTKLIVAGEFYEEEEPYKQLIRQLKLEDSVVLANQFIPDDQVAHYFCAADMVVQPYKHATQSGVTQIAYHFDKPMLVTDVGGLKEMVPDQKVGYVVDPDPKAIADALYDFYDNNRSAAFIAGVKEEKKKYGWDTMVGSLQTLLDTIR